jgi:hypothetical protein
MSVEIAHPLFTIRLKGEGMRPCLTPPSDLTEMPMASKTFEQEGTEKTEDGDQGNPSGAFEVSSRLGLIAATRAVRAISQRENCDADTRFIVALSEITHASIVYFRVT